MAKTTCPMCRGPWMTNQCQNAFELPFMGLDPHAIQSYLDWLYTGEFHINEDYVREDSSYNLQLLKTWTVSVKFDDKKFQDCHRC